MIQPKIIAVPCPYMIFDPDGYHTCELIPCKGQLCLCAWFYDVAGYDLGTYEVDLKTGTIISDYNLPDVLREKQKNNPNKESVPKICPKGYTYEQIDAKIEPLMNRVKWGHRPSDKGDSQ